MTISENGNNPCDGCVFLRDCRHKVRQLEAPYCWVENPRHFMFLKKYYAVRGEGPRLQIATQLAKVTPYTEYRTDLNPKQAQVLSMRNQGYSFNKIGKELRVSKQRAAQIYQEALSV